MKKKLMLLISICAFASGLNTYNAVCNVEEINILAKNITVSASGIGAMDDVDDTSFISIENIPGEMYAIVINDTLNTKETIKEVVDGAINFKTPNASEVYNYTIKIHSSATECENELIRTLKIKSVAYNSWYKSVECMDLREEDPEETFDGCRMFTDKKYTERNFYTELDKYRNSKPEEVENRIKDLFYKYYYFALIPIAVLGVYYVIRLALIKRRKKKDEEQ